MGQVAFSVRMDADLKKEFDSLCREFGMNGTTAFNVFARAVVRERRIPFEIGADAGLEAVRRDGLAAFAALREQASKVGIVDMSMQEINREIDIARREK